MSTELWVLAGLVYGIMVTLFLMFLKGATRLNKD